MALADFRALLEPHLIRHQPQDQDPFYSVSETVLAGIAEEQGLGLAEIAIECLQAEVWPERYRTQRGTFTCAEQARLLSSCAAVMGAGGLGGAVCLLLARIGVGRLIVCDGDVFEESNLNRQFLSGIARLGLNKAECAVEEIARFNPAVKVTAIPTMGLPENLPEILRPADVVIDCLDNLKSRYDVEDAARSLGIPFVHGSLAGMEGMVLTVFPEDPGLKDLYGPTPPAKEDGAETILGTPTLTPALIATMEAAQAVSVLLGQKPSARKKMLYVDLASGIIEANELG